MFVDLNEFIKEKEEFLKEIVLLEINNIEDTKEVKEREELKNAFKDKIRKYIPTCLNHINTMFNIKYSIYKV